MAEIIFPYELPENWQWATLGDVCEYIKAGGDKPKDFSKCKTKSCNVPVVANGIINNGIIGYTSKPKEKSGTITVSGRGTIGYSVLRDYNYYPIVRVIILSTNEKIFSHYLKFVIDYSSLQGIGSSIPQLTIPMLKKFPIPLPPIDEQKRIVEIIKSLFEKLDAAKSIVQKIIDGYELRRAAILHKAFTGELTKNFRADNGLTLDDWQEKTLGDVCQSVLEGDHLPPPKTNQGVPFLVISNISKRKVDFINTRFVSNEYYEKLSATRKPELGDVLYTLTGSYGISVLVDTKRNFCFQRHIALLKPNYEKITSKFLCYSMQTASIYNQSSSIATGTAQLTVPIKGLRKVILSLPPIDEQKEIVRVLDRWLDKEQRTKEIAEKILLEIDLLKRTILARAFRGELGTNNPSEKFFGGIIWI